MHGDYDIRVEQAEFKVNKYAFNKYTRWKKGGEVEKMINFRLIRRKLEWFQMLKMEPLYRCLYFVAAQRSVFEAKNKIFSVFYIVFHTILIRLHVRFGPILYWFVKHHAMAHKIIDQHYWAWNLVVFPASIP